MTHLTRLAAWLQVNLSALEQHGKVSFSYGPPGADNPSAHLLVVLSPAEDAELLVWESGDVEFNRGTFGDSVLEHLEIESAEDFEELLTRFLEAVGGRK